MGKIAKNYLYNLIYSLLVLLVPLVTAPYLSRVLGAEGTGVYSYVNSLTSLICTFALLGIFNYGSRQIAYVRDSSAEIDLTFWRIMSARLLIAAAGTIIYFLIVIIVGRYQYLFLLYYTYLLGYFFDCTWLYVGVEDMKWAVLKNILLKLVSVSGIFIFVRQSDDVAIYVLIQGGSILLANLSAYTQLKRYVGRPKLLLRGIKDDLLQSAKLFLPTAAATVYLQCDKIMLELITGNSAQVSFYDYSEKIVMIPLSFITVLSTVLMPRIANEFANGNRETIAGLINAAAKTSLFIAFPMFFGIIAITGKLIPWYLGEEFLPTISAIYMLSPIILANTLSGISGGQYFTATNQVDILLKSQVLAAVGNIIINALLIPRYGFAGAAAATVISSALCAAVQYRRLLKQVNLSELPRTALRYALLSLLMLLLIKAATGELPATPLTSVIQIAVGAVFYLSVCLLAKDKQLRLVLDGVKSVFKR